MTMEVEAVQAELERILTSRCFRSRQALAKLLGYMVGETLAGNAANLTQQSIAIAVLGKPLDLNDADAALVRVQTGRLRQQLAEYYATEGRFNPLRITLPPRTYQPRIMPHSHESTPSLSQGPGIVCVPRHFLADDVHGSAFITRLTHDYVVSLMTRFNFCQVCLAQETAPQPANWPDAAWETYRADFALFFDLHAEQHGYNLKCSLVHSQTRQIVWAQAFPLDTHNPDATLITAIFRRIANDTLNYERGLAHDFWARQLLASGKPIASHHQVMLALRQQQWTLATPEFRSVLRVCEQRLMQCPEDVQAMLVYADMYRTEYLLKYNAMATPITYLAQFLDTLLQLAPDNAYAHVYLAGFHLLTGNRELCLQALVQAQAINSLDTHLNVTTGLIYIGLGEWQTGIDYIQACIDPSPIYSHWYHIPICLHHYREGHYATALREARKIRMKSLWGPMLRAALYQRNELKDKAAKELEHLHQQHPDFTQASRVLALGFTQSTNRVVKQLSQDAPQKVRPLTRTSPCN